MTARNPKRRKWTAERVEALWGLMTEYQGTRKRGQHEAWWTHIAATLNRKFSGLGLTGKACMNQASVVRTVYRRKYPWELPPGTPIASAPSKDAPTQRIENALFQLQDRIDSLERTIVGVIEDRLAPTPDVPPATNQLWTTQGRAADGNRLNMRITGINTDDDTVTLAEVGITSGGFVYTIPRRRMLADFAFVGLATLAPVATATAPMVPAVDPVDTLVGAATPGNGATAKVSDLSQLMGHG